MFVEYNKYIINRKVIGKVHKRIILEHGKTNGIPFPTTTN